MKHDIITQTLKTYFIEKGKNLKVIQRYLSLKYRVNIEEKLLRKRAKQLTMQ